MEEIKNDEVQKENKKVNIVTTIISFLVFCGLVVFITMSVAKCGTSDSDKINIHEDIRKCTEICLKKNILYPDTFNLKTIEFYRWNTEDEEGYEMWKTVGYFTSESKAGLTIKSDYIVYIKYNKETRQWKKLTVSIDGNLY